MYYKNLITTLLAEINRPEVPARYVEAWIRCEHPTLDHLPRGAFKEEVALAVQCIDNDTEGTSEILAQSYGL